MVKQVGDQLRDAARSLRWRSTEAESLLWQRTRGRQLGGMKFRRQYPIASYVLDFYCHEAKLAIELDGLQHRRRENARLDAERTSNLDGLGIRVLRFTNDDVTKDIDTVLKAILAALAPSP